MDSPFSESEGAVLALRHVTKVPSLGTHGMSHMSLSRAWCSKALTVSVHEIIYLVLTKREQKHEMFNLYLALDHENFKCLSLCKPLLKNRNTGL